MWFGKFQFISTLIISVKSKVQHLNISFPSFNPAPSPWSRHKPLIRSIFFLNPHYDSLFRSAHLLRYLDPTYNDPPPSPSTRSHDNFVWSGLPNSCMQCPQYWRIELCHDSQVQVQAVLLQGTHLRCHAHRGASQQESSHIHAYLAFGALSTLLNRTSWWG